MTKEYINLCMANDEIMYSSTGVKNKAVGVTGGEAEGNAVHINKSIINH